MNTWIIVGIIFAIIGAIVGWILSYNYAMKENEHIYNSQEKHGSEYIFGFALLGAVCGFIAGAWLGASPWSFLGTIIIIVVIVLIVWGCEKLDKKMKS